MIDKRSPKGFFGGFCFCFALEFVLKISEGRKGYSSSGPRCLASLSGSFAIRVTGCPVWEDEMMKRKEEASNGFATNLPMGVSLGGYH